MRAWSPLLVASLLAATVLAGCTIGDELEESIESPDEADAGTPTPDTQESVEAPTPATTQEPTPQPEEPAMEPTPPGDGIIIHPPPEPAPEPTPEPAPTADPAPEPTPAPQEPTPEPTPAPQEPTPAPQEPTPEPEPEEPTWPREGSYVQYRVAKSETYPGTDGGGEDTYTNLSWTYRDGDWHGVCEGESHEHWDGETEVSAIHRTYEASDPPHWPLFNTLDVPEVGGDVRAWFVKTCDIQWLTREYAGTDGDMHVATDYDDGSPDDFHTEWSRDWGLVTTWSWGQRNTVTQGALVATDAPGL